MPNRILLHDRLKQAIQLGRRESKSAALLLLDLDRFKEINDTLGHDYGDVLLKQVATRLQGVLREVDTVARLGGDEFALLLPLTDADGAIKVVMKVLKVLQRPFVIDGITLDVSASIGIALFPEHGDDTDMLLRHADVAMYQAKQSGEGFALYASEYDRHSTDRLTLIGELRRAIEQGGLVVYYQPKVDLKTLCVCGVEALVRWPHPTRGLIPPDEFIPLSEQTGLIKPLTSLVLDQAMRQFSDWRKNNLTIPIAVNLSARNLQDPSLPRQVADLLTTYQLGPSALQLEITENTIMADSVRVMEVLTTLSDMKIELSIDDFGTGYSSLGYLKRLPVTEIKIDRSFVKDMASDESDAIIVQSTIGLAHNLGLRVVAEGVEDEATLKRLIALGCDGAQGYFLSRPLPANKFLEWYEKFRANTTQKNSHADIHVMR